MALEYWREYRTYFHIGQSWGVNESTAYRIKGRLENNDSALISRSLLTSNNIQNRAESLFFAPNLESEKLKIFLSVQESSRFLGIRCNSKK